MTLSWRLGAVFCLLMTAPPVLAAPDDTALRKAVTLYASFDDALRADLGGGDLTFSTRSNHPTEKGKFVFTKGLDTRAFRIARGKGVQGGALECVDVLPRNGRIFLPAKGHIAFKKGGWGATLSVWIRTDPDKLLKTKFCDPIQITQKGANNGGIWFDFNDAKPRDMRMGTFPAVPPGKKGISEDDPKAPMVWVKGVGFKARDWHHIVLTWQNFDTGKPNALATLYIDGKRIGDVKDRAIAMDWALDKTGIYVAVNYIGLLDELALFDRPLTPEEVTHLFKSPALLAPLKKSAPKGRSQLPALQQRTADLLASRRNADPPRFGDSNLGLRVSLQLPARGAAR